MLGGLAAVLAIVFAGVFSGLLGDPGQLLGLQFHPESILTEYGLQLLKNWVKMTEKHLEP